MFRIEAAAPLELKRLVADTQLSRQDFAEIAKALRVAPFQARKIGLIAARQAQECERIETRWNGKETVATAEPGDWVATNLDAAARVLTDGDGNVNVYVIKSDRFSDLYDRAEGTSRHGDIWRSRGIVSALKLPGGFEILTPWGETQRASAGYLLDNGSEVYGNAKETFEQTYRKV